MLRGKQLFYKKLFSWILIPLLWNGNAIPVFRFGFTQSPPRYLLATNFEVSRIADDLQGKAKSIHSDWKLFNPSIELPPVTSESLKRLGVDEKTNRNWIWDGSPSHLRKRY